MGSSVAKTTVVRPKKADKLMVRIATARLFDSLPGAITRAYRLMVAARMLRESEADIKQKRFDLAAIDLEFKILKETILDRTVPTVARVDMQALMAMLPSEENETAVVEKVSDEQIAKQEAVSLLRGVIAKLSDPAAGGDPKARPGLVLIRRENVERAG